MKRYFFSLILVILLVSNLLPIKNVMAAEIVFKDISGHWAEQSILYMADKGKINGYEDQTFRPDLNITRAEMATLLSRGNHIIYREGVTVDSVLSRYSDKDSIPDWAKEGVAFMTSCDFMKGYEDNSFRPNAYITRQEAVVVLGRYFAVPLNQYPGNTFNNWNYKDKKQVASWAIQYFEWALLQQLVNGYKEKDGNYLKPNNNITRAEICTILTKYDSTH